MISDTELSAILNSAIRRHTRSGSDRASLIPFVGQEIIDSLDVSAIALWQVDAGQVRLVWETHATDWVSVVEEQQIGTVQPGTTISAEAIGELSNSDQNLAFASAVLNENKRIVVGFEFFRGALQDDDLIQISEVFADIRRRELISSLSESVQQNHRLLAFLAALHEIQDREELFHRFATDGAAVTGIDRISILSRSSGNRWDLECCSGVDEISVRSEQVQEICAPVSEASAKGTHQETVFPLSTMESWSDAEFAVAFEKFHGETRSDVRFLRMLSSQLAMAIELLDQRVAKKPRSQRRWRRRLNSVSIVAIVLCLALGLSLTPTSFEIRANGEALPVTRQHLFAPDHGVVSEVFVTHGSLVEQGTVICRIYNDELEVLREKTREDLTSSEARLAALKSVSQRSPSTASNNRGLHPSVEQAELETRIESLQKQLNLIVDQIATLSVTAPFDGQVLHERLTEELLGRPVQQGQYLFQIVQPKGTWELLLHIPEHELRHVLAARADDQHGIPISFVLETSPTIEHQAEIRKISSTTDVDPSGGLSTLATARIESEQISNLRFGAGVLGKIDCGKRTWFFVLTRGIFDFWARHSPF